MSQANRILIVEDELIPAYDLADSLKELGYTVTAIVDSGEAAIEQVEDNQPDLILMDIKLRGEMSGIEAAQKICNYGLPVVYLTAFSDEAILNQAAITAVYGYLTKPVRREDIRTTIAVALAKHQHDVRVQIMLAEEQKLNALKSQFLATVAHDLRNPLTSAATSVGILQRYNEHLNTLKRSQHCQRINTSIERMTRQIDDLLLIAQSESGKLPFNPQPLDVVSVCEELVDEFQAHTDRCQLQFNRRGTTTQAILDQALLDHILNNLLSNAIKYSPTGGKVSLNLTCEPHQVTFYIQDQGIGMPQEYLDNLFEPFERATNAKGIRGTGMGLYIVKQAVERHGGQIKIDSQVNKGTTVMITLPSVAHEVTQDVECA